ncbi:PilW family protein [Halomonas sp. GFAJ-1]|uniref:PilW family protein n=1 Tax=Halomonas sp. GFAJ-1 TaxID=1118153 RepID=UPI00023A54C7|nr:prepilin-type N-terminal cleavage/methylation domain-containing protein [Halomonas sp. GFAJ-1]AVI61546.1 prepilin-type N-terminal cleavage/methylation domain-containing protein [Halomonas sp. GFAJ-1]EHK61356.1 hypothetical protein MOY_06750 [Halomonas sp. GFAJ-1]
MDVQRGFTLTELLVAMVISSVVILGAGQLCLSTFHVFRQIDTLGRQQEALIYTAATIADTLRSHHAIENDEEALFRLQCDTVEPLCRCTVQDMQAAEPLVTFVKLGGGQCERTQSLGIAEPSNSVMSVVTLPLGPEGRDIYFHITHRNSILN